MRSQRVKKIVLAAYLVSVLACAGVNLFFHLSNTQMMQASQWMERATQVLEQNDKASSYLRAMEGSQRGYLLTGNESYLKQMEASFSGMRESMQKLRILTAENPGQQERLTELSLAVEERIRFTRHVIDLQQSQGRTAAIAELQTGEGLRLSRAVDDLQAEIGGEEQRLHTLRHNAAEASAGQALMFASATAILNILLISGLFFSLMWQVRQLEEANRETNTLRELTDELQICASSNEAYQTIERQLTKVFGEGVYGDICIVNAAREHVERVRHWGPKNGSGEDNYPTVSCCALRKGGLYLVDDQKSALRCRHLGLDIGSYLAFALSAYGETFGILHVGVGAGQGASWKSWKKQHSITMFLEQISISVAGLHLREKLEAQSIQDPLTKAFNRRYMESTLERELSRSKRRQTRVGLVLVDIDHFKNLNDLYGHQAGDEVLKALVSLMRRSTRSEDAVCRYGGEEFAIIMSDAQAEGTYNRAEALREAVRQLRVMHNGTVVGPLSISAGVAISEEPMQVSELIRIADTRLYRAKELGRNRVVAQDDGLRPALNEAQRNGPAADEQKKAEQRGTESESVVEIRQVRQS